MQFRAALPANSLPASTRSLTRGVREILHSRWSFRTDSLNGNLVNHNTPHPPGVSDVWQIKGLREGDFGSVAIIRLTGGFSGSVANKAVRALEARSLEGETAPPPRTFL